MTNQTALLVMDMQKGIAHNVPQINSLIKANQRAIAAAREHHIPVVFMRVALEKFRRCFPKQSRILKF